MKIRLRLGRVLALGLVVFAVAVGERAASAESVVLESGDVVFQRSRSAQSRAIALATGSEYTHVGVVVVRGGRTLVLEAVGPVRLTPLETWREHGIDGEIVAKRLRDAETRLTPAALRRMARVGRSFLGRPYDLRFAWSDDRLYCSELVYKIYDRALGIRLGTLRPAREFALDSEEIRALLTIRFDDRRPFDPNEPTLSPASIFEDDALETIFAN